MASKRKANWIDCETACLVQSCTDNVKLLSGKHGPDVTEKEKSHFWSNLTDRVNSVGGSSNRTTEEVMKKWKDLKSQTKKKEQVRRREQARTGGGETSGSLKEWEEKIIGIIPDSLLEGIAGGQDLFEDATIDTNQCEEPAPATCSRMPLTETVLIHPANIHVEVGRDQEVKNKPELKRKRSASDIETAQLDFYAANTALCKAQLKLTEQQHRTLAEQENFFKEATKRLKANGMREMLQLLTEQSSACHIIDRCVEAINNRLDNIRFPQGRALVDIKEGFYQRCRIPNTVGAVDGTLIPIVAPSQNEEVYVCRKNFHAINAQAVVDHKARFIDIVSKWPGSTHDASIFDNCGLKGHLERAKIGHLLGDSGYGLKKTLLTPLINPVSRSEVAYNHAHSSGRMVVERAFGLLKSRFRCLHKTGGVLYKQPGKCCKIIVACARLNNFCVDQAIPMPENQQLVVDRQEEALINNPDVNAVAYRQHIIDLF